MNLLDTLEFGGPGSGPHKEVEKVVKKHGFKFQHEDTEGWAHFAKDNHRVDIHKNGGWDHFVVKKGHKLAGRNKGAASLHSHLTKWGL